MSRKLGDPSKAVEAKAALEAGQKALSTSLMKWKPDYLTAEPKFQEAARLYKQAGLLDSAVECWKQAINCSIKMNNMKQAVVTLESTARELTVASSTTNNAYKEAASNMLAEAGQILHELGESGRAADFKLRAGKLLEGFNNAAAAKHYDEACSYFDGDEEKDVYAKEALSKALNHQLALGKHASAMRTMDKLAKVFVRLNQPHNLYKLILSRVILLLAASDPVAAQKEYDKHMDAMDFMSSTEAACAEDLLHAFGEMDQEGVKKVVERNTFNYLDHAVAGIAKKLPSAVISGKTIGAAHAEETATKAVSYDTTPATIGGFRVIGGGSNLNASLGSDSATQASLKASASHSVDRAALFAKAPGSSSVSKSAPAPVEEPASGAGDAGEGDFGAADYDYEAAFQSLGVEDGHAGAGSEHHETGLGDTEKPAASAPGPASPTPAPAPATEPEPAAAEEDVGIW